MVIRSKTKTKTVDHGFKGIIKEMRKLEKKPFVKIGYPAKSKKTGQAKEKSVQVGDQLLTEKSEFVTVLDVAIFQEFGTVNSPERSFIRASYDKNMKKYLKLNEKLLTKIYSNRMTVEKALDILGETILNDIKAFLVNNEVSPPSQRAIDEGGSTLVDTAQLLNSLTYIKVMNP